MSKDNNRFEAFRKMKQKFLPKAFQEILQYSFQESNISRECYF